MSCVEVQSFIRSDDHIVRRHQNFLLWFCFHERWFISMKFRKHQKEHMYGFVRFLILDLET
jgi:hypothetical protein